MDFHLIEKCAHTPIFHTSDIFTLEREFKKAVATAPENKVIYKSYGCGANHKCFTQVALFPSAKTLPSNSSSSINIFG